jgi:drug/metabolite transporter (DMT)-like permease
MPSVSSPHARPAYVALAYVAVSVLWGTTYLAIRVALESYPPFLLGGVRFLAAGATLYVVALLRRERTPRAAEWGASALTGCLLFVAGNGLVNLAEQSVSSGLASVLVTTMPLWATIMARLFGERVSIGEAAGVLLGLAGVAVLNMGGDLRASPTGAVLLLLAPMGWALGSIAGRRLPLPGGMMRTATQMLVGGVGCLVVGAIAGEHPVLRGSGRAIAAVVYLWIFGSLVGFSAYSYLLKHTRPAVATSYAYINPVIAVILGVVLAHESFGAASLLGAVIVLAAVVLVGRAKARMPAAAPTPVVAEAAEGE